MATLSKKIKERAIDASCLDERILKNVKHQKIDLVQWIFDRVNVPSGGVVLELCSGTGNQTIELLKQVGENGKVFALDISEKALKKLKDKTPVNLIDRLITIPASIDSLQHVLKKVSPEIRYFDLIFCAYGLYYSERPEDILREMLHWIAPDGSIIIVGPFGPNNAYLFNFLEISGVKIPDYVRYTSQDFMEKITIPFATRHFSTNNRYTMVNPVIWKKQEDVFQYWQNSTFFDEKKKEKVKKQFDGFFKRNDEFVNEKWVMMIEMSDKIKDAADVSEN